MPLAAPLPPRAPSAAAGPLAVSVMFSPSRICLDPSRALSSMFAARCLPGRYALLMLDARWLRGRRRRHVLAILIAGAPGAQVVRAQGGYLFLEVRERFETPVHRREPQVGEIGRASCRERV